MKLLFSLLFNLLKDLLIKNDEELSFKSAKFDGRKAVVLLLIVALFLSNALTINRVFDLVVENIALQERVMKCQEDPSDSSKSPGPTTVEQKEKT